VRRAATDGPHTQTNIPEFRRALAELRRFGCPKIGLLGLDWLKIISLTQLRFYFLLAPFGLFFRTTARTMRTPILGLLPSIILACLAHTIFALIAVDINAMQMPVSSLTVLVLGFTSLALDETPVFAWRTFYTVRVTTACESST